MYKKSSNSYWSSENDKILIDFVRKHEAIYNIKSKEYRKTELKQNWWREIGAILNKTDSDCSKRWYYIRDYYVRRRGKPGTGGEAAKKRADLLSFLDSLPSSQRSCITNVVDENPGDTYSAGPATQTESWPPIRALAIDPGHNYMKIENTHDTSERTQSLEDSDSEEIQSNTQEIENFICDTNDHKIDDLAKSDKKLKNNAHAQEHLNLLEQIANLNSTENGLDENDLFFGSMAKIVKKLPPYEQVQLRLQIGSLVGNAELRHISNN